MNADFFDKLVNSVEDIVFQADHNLQFTFLNAAWERHTGFQVIHSLGKPLQAFLYSLSGEALHPSVMPVLENKMTSVRIKQADGSFAKYNLKLQSFENPGYFTGVISKYDEVVGKPEFSGEDNSLLAAIVDHCAGAMHAIDHAYRIIFCNQVYAQQIIQGLHKEVKIIPGETFLFDLMDQLLVIPNGYSFSGVDDYRQYWKSQYDRALKGESFQVECRMDLEGNSKYFVWSFQPISHVLQQVTGCSVMSHDITELIDRQKQLRFQSSILKNVKESIITTSAEGFITYYNPGAEAIFGYTPEEMLGESLDKLYETEYSIRTLSEILQGKTLEREMRAKHKNGQEVWLNITCSPIRDKAGEVSGLLEVGKDITRRKDTELRLRESEEIKSAIIHALPDIIFYINKEGVYLEAYAKNEEELALPKEEIIGKTVFEVLEPELGEEWRKVLDRALKTNEVQTITYPLCINDKNFWFEGRTVKSSEEHVIVLIRNITEEVLADQKLRESEEKFRLLAENSLDIVSLFSTASGFLFISPSLTRILGFTPEEYMNSNLFENIHPDDLEKSKEKLSQWQQGLEHHEIVYRIKNNEGNYIWMENRGRRIGYDAKGGAPIVLNVSRDITQQIKAEQDLKYSEQKLKEAQQIAHIGSYEYDLQTGKIAWSDELYNIMGVDASFQHDVTHLLDLLHPQDKDIVVNKFYQAISDGNNFTGDYRIVRPDGNLIHVLGINRVVLDEEGKPVKTIGTIQDITERKKAEKQIEDQNKELRRLNHELDNLIYSSSHDLRSPLASSLGLLSIIQMEKDPVKKEEYLMLMGKSLKRLDNFTRDILDLYKNARSAPLIEKVDFQGIVEEVLEEHRFTEGADLIKKVIDIKQATDFYSENRRVKIIFSNLISNAIRYHNLKQSDPYMEITGIIEETQATIHVKDNGQGIEDIHKDKIFDMFYRANAEKKGSGLGLYLVKETVEKLKGNITLKSTLGKGTTFTILLSNLK